MQSHADIVNKVYWNSFVVKRKYEEQVVQCYQIVQVIMTIIFFPDVGCKINTLKKLQNEQNVEGGEIS